MKNSDFIHLHVHNEYSMLDGYGTAEQWTDCAKQLGFNAIGLTNHGNVDGCLSWMRACNNGGISPVLGAELYITQDVSKKGKGMAKGHMVVLCDNQSGWEQLCALLTRANLEGSYGGRPYVDYEMVLNCDLSGWEIMTGCIGSFLNLSGSDKFFRELWERRRNHMWFEIMPANHPKQIEYHKKWKEKGFLKLPLVATVDCHYPLPEHNKVQDVLIAIQRNYKWNDPKRWSLDFRELYLMPVDEVYDGFVKQDIFSKKQIITAMQNTLRIADRCKDFRIEEKPISLPDTPKDYDFDILIHNGLIDKNLIGKREYEKRINQEYEVIQKKSFQSYYLIVKDVVDYCKREGIRVGPGRGSVGGSLIAYLLGITQIDPIKYDLSFSRFISEDRNDLPDIDLDFEMNKRHLVYEYLERTYKKGCAVLSTYPRIKTKGAIRDIGRVFEIPEKDVSEFANLFNYNEADQEKFEKITKAEKAALYFKKTYPEAFELIHPIIGQIRATGQHPAAVILSNRDLTDGSTCVIKKTSDGKPVVNWVMEEVEYFGLVKLDVLGLSTLSVIDYAEELINFNNRQNINCREIDIIKDISFNDSKIFNLINQGKTAGIFQIAAYSTTKLCVEMGIDYFEDWIAAIALVRPGPTDSGMTADYLERKHGKSWDKMHSIYEDITKHTYGVMIYQEQIMQAISRLAGMSESEADSIRKIIGKKRDIKEFEFYRRKFLAGCASQKTMTADEANHFWQGLLKWANYGFNRAHSVEYAIVGYWTAWLKVYYPVQFYCAALTYGAEKKQPLIDEISEAGYKIVAPKVKKSDPCKWVFDGNELYMPFNELKGIGSNTANDCCHITKRKTRKDLFGNNINNNQSKVEDLLYEIKACDDIDCELEILNKHLDFEVKPPMKSAIDRYPNLLNLIGFETNLASAEAIGKLDIQLYQVFTLHNIELIKEKQYRDTDVADCTSCNLRQECTKPVMSSVGQYNVFITLEAPGKGEDKQGIGAVDRAGTLLWKEIQKYGYTRRHFHVSNCCHCWPSKSKTPNYKQIDKCVDLWLLNEFANADCRLMLACGNVPLYAIKGQKGGIEALSGETEWIEDWELWICWCTHPSHVLRNPKKRPLFEKGIKNFIDKFELLLKK